MRDDKLVAVDRAADRTPSQGVRLKLFAATLCLHGCFLLV